MSLLAEALPGATLLLMALGFIGAAAGLMFEVVWDEWQASKRWRDLDRLARVESIRRGPPAPRRASRGRRGGRRWEATLVRPGS